MSTSRVLEWSVMVLALLSGAALPAVVLPRPPSSPNFIPQEAYLDSKGYSANDKGIYQNTNVEKPDTQDYRLLEIEVQDPETVETLDLHGLVQAVLDNQQQMNAEEELDNATYPHPEVVPHSILGVRNVGLSGLDASGRHRYLLSPQPSKNLADEKLYYLKSSRPKVYVNFRGKSGNFRESGDSKATMRFEPGAYLRATPAYQAEKKTKSPKKYDARIHGASTTEDSAARTTENSMQVTSSELPKQIPAPPSRIPSRSPIAHTTPVQRYSAPRRTDILPGYAFEV